MLAAAFLFTLATQQPFAQMDMTRYFRDWFPVYVARTDDATPAFWSMLDTSTGHHSCRRRDAGYRPVEVAAAEQSRPDPGAKPIEQLKAHSVVCPVTTATTFLFTVEPVLRMTFTIRVGLR